MYISCGLCSTRAQTRVCETEDGVKPTYQPILQPLENGVYERIPRCRDTDEWTVCMEVGTQTSGQYAWRWEHRRVDSMHGGGNTDEWTVCMELGTQTSGQYEWRWEHRRVDSMHGVRNTDEWTVCMEVGTHRRVDSMDAWRWDHRRVDSMHGGGNTDEWTVCMEVGTQTSGQYAWRWEHRRVDSMHGGGNTDEWTVCMEVVGTQTSGQYAWRWEHRRVLTFFQQVGAADGHGRSGLASVRREWEGQTTIQITIWSSNNNSRERDVS